MEDLLAHSAEEYPNECCGLLVADGKRDRYVPCVNSHSDPLHRFTISGDDYLRASKLGKILAVCHSHPQGPRAATPADIAACERSGLPWYIALVDPCEIKRIQPTGFMPPLVGREYLSGVFDCYALVRDYYLQELDILMPYFESDEGWQERGEDLFRQHADKTNFRRVDDLKKHDVIVMQFRAKVPEHFAVYLGDEIILHHLANRLSTRDVYGGYWERHTVAVMRHESFE